MPCKYTFNRYARKASVGQMRDAIRKDWMRYPVKFAAIQQRAERVELPDGRKKTLIRCCGCSGLFPRAEIEANHINPVGPLASASPEDVEQYLARMFCKKAEIEPLCKPCHGRKTAQHKKTKETTCPQADTAP